jgi:acetoacetyl-CoA synthetase
MMHNFLIATLVAGCAIVLYDGAPLKPANVLWELADRYGITVFGTSAGYLSALQRSGYRPKDEFPNLKVRQVS